MAQDEPLELAKAHWAKKKPASPIYAFLLDRIEIVSATSGSFKARLELTPAHVNSKGSIHGTTSACIVDWAGGVVIASTGSERTGVSTDIHVSYVSTAKIGEVLEIDCKANKIGRTMAYISVEICRLSDGAVVATGSHSKFCQ